MKWLQDLLGGQLFSTGNSVAVGFLNVIQYLFRLFTSNPLVFLGGLILLRVSQKGFKFKLSDIFDVKL